MNSNLIIITGLAAAGKTTIGKYLAHQLNYVFLSKDSLKESLFDDLGVKDREWSKDVGKASYSLLYLLLEELLSKRVSVVVETNFVSGYDSGKFMAFIDKYSPSVKQLLCHSSGDVLYKRFVERAGSKERHVGHNDVESHQEHKNLLLTGKAKPLRVNVPLIEVDTTDWGAVDMEEILREVG